MHLLLGIDYIDVWNLEMGTKDSLAIELEITLKGNAKEK